MERNSADTIKSTFSSILNDGLLCSLLALLLYLLYYYVNFFALHLILIFIVSVECSTSFAALIFCLLSIAIVATSTFMPMAPLVLPVSDSVTPDIELLYTVYGQIINEPSLQIWELATAVGSGFLFRSCLNLSWAFELISVSMALLLFVLLDSDGLFLLGPQLEQITVNPSLLKKMGQPAKDVIDLAVITSLYLVAIYLSISTWVGSRISAWYHNAYNNYAKIASNMRVSYAYLFVLLGVLAFDPPWFSVMFLPIYLSVLSLTVCFFEKQKFKRPEAILVALFIGFVLLYFPGPLLVISVAVADCIMNVRRWFTPINQQMR